MKKLVLGVGFMALAGVALPLSNLIIGPDPEAVKLVANLQDPQHKAAATVFANKCLDCHSSATRMPSLKASNVSVAPPRPCVSSSPCCASAADVASSPSAAC